MAQVTSALTDNLSNQLDVINNEIKNNPELESRLQELNNNLSIMTTQEINDAFASIGFSEALPIGSELYNAINASLLEANEARDNLANVAVALLAQAFNDVEIGPEMFQRLGYNFTAGFTSAFAEALPAAQAQMLYETREFYNNIMAQANSAEILQAVQATDFSDMASVS